jgi:hypothetical protein
MISYIIQASTAGGLRIRLSFKPFLDLLIFLNNEQLQELQLANLRILIWIIKSGTWNNFYLIVYEIFDTSFEFIEKNIIGVDYLVIGTNDNRLF